MRTSWLVRAGSLCFALMATAFLTYCALDRDLTPASTSRQLVPVVVAARDVPAGTLITMNSVTVRLLPANEVPRTALAGTEQAFGKYAVHRLVAGQIVLERDVLRTRLRTNAATR